MLEEEQDTNSVKTLTGKSIDNNLLVKGPMFPILSDDIY